MNELPKIYLAAFPMGTGPTQWGDDDYQGVAMAEDGTVLAGHLSSSLSYAKGDMNHPYKHQTIYQPYYPDGYDVEWVDDPATHPGWQAAMALNRRRNDEGEA